LVSCIITLWDYVSLHFDLLTAIFICTYIHVLTSLGPSQCLISLTRLQNLHLSSPLCSVLFLLEVVATMFPASPPVIRVSMSSSPPWYSLLS
jgi:hypothetical protein